jgi:CopG family transcriptional regulator/antitoxin EndoAI
MARRLNISLPERTVALIDRVAGKGRRSALIDRAVVRYVQEESHAKITEQLAAGARDRADRDLQLAEEWFPVESAPEDSSP